jgi:hypothetical protein
LFGSLSSEPVVSRRVQAALATGVLALSTAAPGAVAAQERHRQQEGVAVPEQPRGYDGKQPSGDAIEEPDFDPGGETALPYDVGPEAPPATEDDPVSDDGAPVESEPIEDPDARLLAPGEPAQEAPPAEDTPVPPTEAAPVTPVAPAPPAPAPAPVPAPAPPPASTTEEPAGTYQPASPKGRADRTERSGRAKHDERNRRTEAVPDETTRSAPDRPPSATLVDVAPSLEGSEGSALIVSSPTVPAEPQPVAVAQTSRSADRDRPTASRDARFHVVKPGESLWSIARKLLGGSASPAQIAREVDRLWALNKDRIGTGNRDLLMVGTKLRLR